MQRRTIVSGIIIVMLLGVCSITFNRNAVHSEELQQSTTESTIFEILDEEKFDSELSLDEDSEDIDKEEAAAESKEEMGSNTEISEERIENPKNDYLLESDEEFVYTRERSDIAVQKQNYSATYLSIPSVSADNTNVPPKSFIDVSSWNGPLSVADYNIIKSYGITGVVVKLTEYVTYQNPYAKEQIENALKAGLRVSVYHYSHFTDRISSRKEADYFANMAISLGLSKNTTMVNDIEDYSLVGNKTNTDNSLEFEKRLIELGFTNVNHYVGANWINEGIINPNILGNKKVWVAAYPYTLNSTPRYTEYGAWQWSSRLTFPGVAGEFDISADYGGNFVINNDEAKYITVEKSMPLWDFNQGEFTQIGNTNQYIGKTLKIHTKMLKDNVSYYQIVNNNGDIIGYIQSYGTRIANDAGGLAQNYNTFITINSNNYSLLQNLSGTVKESTISYNGQVFFAKTFYQHFNGNKYLSLYDSKGDWLGLIDERGTDLAEGEVSKAQNYDKKVQIGTKNYILWQNLQTWSRKGNSSSYMGQILYAKTYYTHFNGAKYLSLYDNQGKWLGIINEKGTDLAEGEVSKAQNYDKKVQIGTKNYILWQNLQTWSRKGNSSSYMGQILYAKTY
ncbi:hypothetical protein IV487_14780, partial [Enterococcus saccharolyticus]|uniref:GH25 family lysozyme n=1 Tax=Enterococcus saccharolyticus TaxID=41997 RepID=UPI002279D994